MKRKFCGWVVEVYFASDWLWLPEWFVHWCHRNADAGAMGRGMVRWRKKNPFHPGSGEVWANADGQQCGACSRGDHADCSGWCHCPKGPCDRP